MCEKFLYVFSKSDCETLIALGYSLLCSDNTKNIYVFENNNELKFNEINVRAVCTDILTF